jgi:secreted trypsin-like serine protease
MLLAGLLLTLMAPSAHAVDLYLPDGDVETPEHPYAFEYDIIKDIDIAPGLDDLAPGDAYVVGGEPVQDDTWADTAGIVFYGSYVGCTGTLIHPKVVLTAAHCMDGGVSHVVLNSKNWQSNDGEIIAVESGWGNRGYQGWGSDIAVLVLEEKASVPHRVVGADCIIDDYLERGAPVAIVGYGNINEAGGRGTSTLYEGYSTVANADCDREQINGFYAGCDPRISPGGEIAAGGDGVDACYGDSGGPLYLLTDKGDYLVGVTSRSYAGVPSSAPCKYGGIWTRPDYFLDWIEQTTDIDIERPQCNERPRVSSTTIVTTRNTPGSTFVEVNDPDGESHTLSVLEAPANGRIDITGDTVTYTPNPGFKGEDPFVIGITDDGSEYEASGPITVRLGLSATVLAGCGGCSGLGGPTSLAGMLALGSLLLARRRRV